MFHAVHRLKRRGVRESIYVIIAFMSGLTRREMDICRNTGLTGEVDIYYNKNEIGCYKNVG